MQQIWWYGEINPPQNVECYLLENTNDVGPGDIVLILESVGMMAVQRLLTSVPDDAKLIIVQEQTDRQKIRQWKSMSIDGVINYDLLNEYLNELVGGYKQVAPSNVVAESIQEQVVVQPVRMNREVGVSHAPIRKPNSAPNSKTNPKPSRIHQQLQQARPQRQLPAVLDQANYEDEYGGMKPPKSGGFFNKKKKPKRERERRQVSRQVIDNQKPWMPSIGNQKGGKIVGVVSARGQVGKSLFVANAASVCSSLGMKTLVIEGDPVGTLAHIVIHRPLVTMTDLLYSEGFTDIKDYIDTTCEYGFHALFAGADGETVDEGTLEWLKQEILRIRNQYSIIFIDFSHEHSTINTELLGICDDVLFFVKPDVEINERSGERFRLLLAGEDDGYGLHSEAVHLVISRFQKGIHTSEDRMDVMRYMNSETIGEIPEVPIMHKYTRLGEVFSLRKKNHKYAKEIYDILSQFIYLPKPSKKWGVF